MKKILHVLTDTNIGGAGRYFLNLASQWNFDKYQLFVAFPTGGELEKQLMKMNVGKLYPMVGGERSLSLDHIKTIRNIIYEEKIDIVHTHASLSGRIAGKLSGCRVLMTRHGLSKSCHGPIKRFLTNISYKLLTDAVIAVSRAVMIDLIDDGVPSKMIHIIHNGIQIKNPDNIKPKLRKEFNISEDVPIIGIVARLVDEKGHRYALEAMPLILRKHPEVQLVLIGDGPQREFLEKLSAQLGIKENLYFLGYRRDVEDLLKDVDIFLLPSISEGLGIALIEAMSLGKPVIATSVGGIPEVIRNGRNGYLIPPKDPKAIAKCILEILSSPKSSQMLGLMAKKTAHEKFSAKTMTDKTFKIYDTILPKGWKKTQ